MEALVLAQNLRPSSLSPVWLLFCDSQAHQREDQLPFLIFILNTGFQDAASVSGTSLLLNICALGLGGILCPESVVNVVHGLWVLFSTSGLFLCGDLGVLKITTLLFINYSLIFIYFLLIEIIKKFEV